MLSEKEIKLLQEELETAKNPLFIHDDDADGLASFLLLYRIHRKGHGIPLKTAPKLDTRLVRKVNEYAPDKIFVLDVPIVEQEFIDAVNIPIFWIDHHMPLDREKVHYFNPRIKDPDAYIPTTRMAYQVSQNTEDLWIATAGCLADYYLPDFIGEFIKTYPYLLAKEEDLPTIIYKRPVGDLVKLFFFILKGKFSDARKSVKIMTRIQSPDEIFRETTAQGKFLYKRYMSIKKKYEVLLKEAKNAVTRSKLVLFYYSEESWSFTANLANELAATYPKKVIIIARKKGEEMKCSLRAQTPILPMLKKALENVDGYGGGHPVACGAVIKEHDWEKFLAKFKEEL